MDPRDEADLMGSIAEYAMGRYREKIGDLVDKYWESIPERDWDLPDEGSFKNFLCYLIYEVPFLKGNRTIAEEYASLSKGLDPETRSSLMKIRNAIRSRFVVISCQGKHRVEVKDLKTKLRYPSYSFLGSVLSSRITLWTRGFHPFGDHYRFIGFYNLIIAPLVLDPEVYVDAWKRDRMGDLESIEIKPGSSFSPIMMKYPAHWIDKMAEKHGVEERLKRDKVRGIMEVIIENMTSIWKGLSPQSKEAITIRRRGTCTSRYRYNPLPRFSITFP